MTVASIYEPIREDLIIVEESIRAFCRPDEYPWMAEPLSYVLESGGKRIRPALVLLSAKFYRYDLEKLVLMAAGVEVFHNATLVHDDFVDRSSTRRGKPTVVNRWGESVALLLGDYMFAGSGDLVCRTGNLRVTQLFAQTIMKICSGQLKELMGAYNWQRSRQDYYAEIDSKTATLFSTSAEAGAILSDAPEEPVQALRSYGYSLGMAFQIIDDILDFVGTEEDLGKPAGGDLLQGTVTLPAILFVEKYRDHNPLRELYENKGDPGRLQQLIQMIRDSTAIQESYDIAAHFSAEACRFLQHLPETASRHSLQGLAHYLLERRK